ncbi:MAG: hypothetical protein Q9224_004384 [Gallowayella concinna]
MSDSVSMIESSDSNESSHPKKGKGIRASTPKVRTVRRVKCDESKPSCVRCTSTGRKCDGYALVPESKSRRKGTKATASDSVTLLKRSSSPVFELFENDAERRSFSFFKDRTLVEISGYFPSDFWERLVPLASFHEPALKHAVIALASLHERYEKGDRSVLKSNKDIAEGGFALQQYNKAIRCLIKPSGSVSKPALDTSLVACVLFACFESLRGHHGSALSHIHSGTQILTQLNEQEGDSDHVVGTQRLCVPLETLDVVFTRLDHQEVQLLGTRPMLLPRVRPNAHPGFHPHVPASFSSLEEARNSLDYQWNLCLRKAVDFEYNNCFKDETESQEQRDAYEIHRIHFRAVFEQWTTAFQNFLKNNVTSMNSKSLQGAMVLKMNATLAASHLELGTYRLLHDLMCWDDIMPVYEEFVDLAAAVIDAQKASNESLDQKPVFQLDHSIIGPLFSVGHKCRDPFLRRKAISMLYSAPRQEGAWDSILTARVCERIMHLEEEGLGEVKCAADIPEWKRISDIHVSFDLQARRGHIKLLRRRTLEGEVREPITDILEW